VFDGSGAPPILDAAILVRDGHILEIGPEDLVRVPRGAQEHRLDGKWVIPGLIDSHVHASAWTLTRFLSYGVTTIRSMGGPRDSIAVLRDAVSLGSTLGPRMYVSGPIIDGSPATWPDATSAASAADARRAVDDRVLMDATQVKVYTKIDRSLLAAILDEAEALQIPVAAHLGLVDAVSAAEMGVRSIEHMTGVVEATLSEAGRLFRAHRSFFDGWKSTTRSWANLDSTALDATASSLVAADATIVPTLALYETYVHLADDEYISGLDLTGVPQSVRDEWDVPDLIRRAQLTQSDFRLFRRSRPTQDLFVRLYQNHGGNIVAGTDTPHQLIAPGASLHDELALLVAAGLSPNETLLAATKNAATLLDADSIGVLAVGNVADFVILSDNPLTDIRNTRSVEQIVFKGAGYRPSELRMEW
jgi:imidazolonepropionase-like amidohydrolase